MLEPPPGPADDQSPTRDPEPDGQLHRAVHPYQDREAHHIFMLLPVSLHAQHSAPFVIGLMQRQLVRERRSAKSESGSGSSVNVQGVQLSGLLGTPQRRRGL